MSGLKAIGRQVEAWLHSPAPAERLAALRIAIGGFVTVYLAANFGEFERLANRSSAQFDPIGIARLLSGPLPPTALWTLFGAALGAGTAFTAGLWTRGSGPTFALLVLGWTSYHSSWGQLLHFEHLFTLHLLVLGFAPVGDAWALRVRTEPGQPSVRQPSARYGWPIRLLALTTVITYLLSGIAKLKLSGTDWFESGTLANHIGYSATRIELVGGASPPLARFVLQNQWLIVPMAVASLAVELCAPLALLGTRLRTAWVAAALCFHAGTAATMMVFFGYRGLGVALLPLFAVEQIASRSRRRELLPVEQRLSAEQNVSAER